MKFLIRLLLALICSFFTVAGVGILWMYGHRAADYLSMSGGAQLGALAMACYALMGLIFTAVFGYLAYRILTPIICLLQGVICLLVSTGGHLVNQQHEPETYLLSLQQPLQLGEMTLTVTQSPANDQIGSARLLTKDRKGEHEQIILTDQHWEYRGWDMHYRKTTGDTFTLDSHYQPGTFWMKVGNLGCFLSIVVCVLLLVFSKKGAKNKSDTGKNLGSPA